MSNEATIAAPSYEALQRQVERRRKSGYNLSEPSCVGNIRIPNEFMVTSSGQQFLHHDSGPSDSKRFLVFSTNQNLAVLSQCEHWYCDGTFKVAPTLFQQMYTIHGLYENKTMPLVYVLMFDRTEESYDRVLQSIQFGDGQPRNITTDYEKAAQNAFGRHFPEVEMKGCFFHLCQSVHRKVQELGLQQDYLSDESLRIHAKMLPALAAVPPDDVVQSFQLIEWPERLDGLVAYFENTYIGLLRGNRRLSPLFPTGLWNIHQRISDQQPRTNNAIEGWHRAFNQFVGVQHPSVYKFVENIQKEQSNTERQLLNVSAGSSGSQSRSKYRKITKRMQTLVRRYSTMDRAEFLRGIAYNIHF